MADFAFWGSFEDRLLILRGILALAKYQLLGSYNNPTPEPIYFPKVDEKLAEKLLINQQLYISGSFTTSSISILQIRGGKYDGTYVIRPEFGGPLLMLSLPYCKSTGPQFELGPGHLYYQRHYWVEHSNQEIVPSPELKNAFKEIQKEIKKYVFWKKDLKIWIGHDAWKLLMANQAKISIRGKWLTKKDIITDSA